MTDNFFKDPEWLAKFLERIETLMAEKGLAKQKDFNKRIGIQRAITRWKKRETSPGFKSCLAIREAFGRSLDWIIFGEGPTDLLYESPGHYEARLPAPVDAALLSQTIASVEDALKKNKIAYDAVKRGRLISRIYEHCAEEKEKPTVYLIEKYLLITD